MNVPNNKRRRASQQRIETALAQLLAKRQLRQIEVSAICHEAGVNRSTFYSNYKNLNDLVAKIGEHMEADFVDLYRDEVEQGYNSNDYLQLFRHIKENRLFYKMFFDLGLDSNIILSHYQYDQELAHKLFDNKFLDYHVAFFRAGLNAILKKWLSSDCRETPEDILEIFRSEYKNKV
ncbi:MAG: TetR-like C-terminal domain-containing protein [Candidatus Nanoperiomorbaceae bacterium]